MVCTRENIKFDGLNIWSDEAGSGRSPKVDIIAVQNLGEHPYDTWVKKVPSGPVPERRRMRDKFSRLNLGKGKQRQESGGEGSSGSFKEVMWLRDLLVPSIVDARVATYSYKSDWGHGDVQVSLRRCAEQFSKILLEYMKDENKPTILIGHGIGNLIIQQALVLALDRKIYANLYLSVTSIVFLGTPFQARSDVDFKNWLAGLNVQDDALSKLLVKDSPELYNMVGKFWMKSQNWEIACFNEKPKDGFALSKAEYLSLQTEGMDRLLLKILNTDYSGLNKFSGHDDVGFRSLLAELQRVVDCGATIIAERHQPKFSESNSSKAHKNVHWTVPKPVNDLFIGRNEILSQMREAFGDGNPPLDRQKRFVITGLGGQGKSEICLKFATLQRDKFWAVFWVDVGDSSTAELAFIGLAKKIGHSVMNMSEALQALAAVEQNWLLILDNADDYKFDYQNYIPSGSRGAVLITSRVSDCKAYNTVGAVALEGLEDSLPVELLLQAAEIQKNKWSLFESQAQEIVRILGSHTLTLIQAGAYIAKGHCQMREYPEVFQEQKKQLMKFHGKQAQSRYSNVYATFEASARVLEQSGSEEAEDALQLLSILSMLDSSFLPLQVFEYSWAGAKDLVKTALPEYSAIGYMTEYHASHLPSFIGVDSDKWNSNRLTTATLLLASLSLVNRREMDGVIGISMHPLAHTWAKERQNSQQHALSWITAGCVLIFSQLMDWRAQEKSLLPHVWSYTSVEIAKIFSFAPRVSVITILAQCSRVLREGRQDVRLHNFLAKLGSELNADTNEIAQSFPLLAGAMAGNLRDLGKSEEAVKLFEHAHQTLKLKLPADDYLYLSSQHQLAGAYLGCGQVTDAINQIEQVVQTRRVTLPESDPNLLASQHELARAYLANGQVSDALELFKNIVWIKEATLSESHPRRLVSQHELASAYLENGQISESLELFKIIVQIKEAILSESHPERLVSQHALARAYYKDSQVEEAIKMLEHVVAIQRTSLPEGHPSREVSEKALEYVLSKRRNQPLRNQ